MTTQALTAPQPPKLPEITELQTLEQIAASVAKSTFVPKGYQGKPGDVLAAALYGREFGWSLMQSLQYLSVIQGKPTMSAEAMVACIRRLGHSITCEAWTTETCRLRGRHALTGDEEVIEFSMQDAQRANLTGDNWRKYPKAMLRARATTMLARALFADAIMGISYTPEEMGSVEPAIVGDIEIVREEPASAVLPEPEPARRAAPRRKVGPVGDRCEVCDGYGQGCPDCKGTGARKRQEEIHQQREHFEPVASESDAELDALLEDDSDNGNYVWHALQDIEIPHASLTDGYDTADDANADSLPLSFDLLGYLCHAMVAAGRANGLAEAVDKVRGVTVDMPDVDNAWAIQMANRMRHAAVTPENAE